MLKTGTPIKNNTKNPKLKKKTGVKRTYVISLAVFGMLALGTSLFLSQSQQQQQTMSNAASDCTVSATDMQEKPTEQDFLNQINAYRATKGAGPLVWSNDLKKSAQWLSNDMAAKNYLNHTDSLGRTPEARFAACGITIQTGDEENILEGATSAADALQIWQGDVPHDSNMTNPQMKQIGIGSTNGYWTTDFLSDDPGTTSSSTPATGSAVEVPSPNCLGGCPISPPTIAEVSPVASISPTVNLPTNLSTNNTGGAGLLLLLLQIFLSLFQNMF